MIHLFSDYDIRGVMENHEHQMAADIDSYAEDRILNTSPHDLADYFAEKHSIEPLELLEDHIRADVRDEKVDVSQDRDRFIRDRSRPFLADGTTTEVELPFRGDPDLLKCVGSRRTMAPPVGIVGQNSIKYPVSSTNPDAAVVRREIEGWVKEVKQGVSWVRELLDPWLESLPEKALQRIEQRRAKLLRDRDFGEALGIPLKRRSDAAESYVAPEIRRKPPPAPPPPSSEPYKPEPALSSEEYEHILDIVQKTATMLERSPRAFSAMGEEQLRDQFLVPLNSHYEGQATGETFNVSGKTDILVRVQDRPVFIAECKVWRGEKALKDAVDQLLGYASWRDNKTALLVFNRNKNLSGVLSKVPGAVEEHPAFKRTEKFDGETGFRFVLANRDDPNREIILTVLVFDVPEAE